MLLKTIIDEDFSNYELPVMQIATCYCDWKCPKEANLPISICQNEPIAKMQNVEISTDEIFRRYKNNQISKGILFAGLEPMLQFKEVLDIIKHFRVHGCDDVVIIFTGYYHHEIEEKVMELEQFSNIIIKYGRFILNQETHYDGILGVNLASPNQYAEKIS